MYLEFPAIIQQGAILEALVPNTGMVVRIEVLEEIEVASAVEWTQAIVGRDPRLRLSTAPQVN